MERGASENVRNICNIKREKEGENGRASKREKEATKKRER
jgi:hypothetical protein